MTETPRSAGEYSSRKEKFRALGNRILALLPEWPFGDARLGTTLRSLDKRLPDRFYNYDPLTRTNHSWEKKFHPGTIQRRIEAAFSLQFASSKKELTEITNNFLDALAPPPNSVHDTVPLGQIERFLNDFPGNLVTHLQYQASAKNIAAILEFGTRAIKEREGIIISEAADKGNMAELIGKALPQLVAHQGTDCLRELQNLPDKPSIYLYRKYVDFRLRYKDGPPEAPFKAEAVVAAPIPQSPLLHEATEAWRGEAWMGAQARTPEWGDLAAMVAATGQWDREYGLKIAQPSKDKVYLGFNRGSEDSITNKDLLGKGEKVFFHSHPSRSDESIYAPLVSPDDVHATGYGDHGGGYLNVVCANGITFHIGSQPAEDDRLGWRVASGEHKGAFIGPPMNSAEGKVLTALQDSQEPYAYTITSDSEEPRTLTFVHVPWQHLNQKVDLHDVCFGEGLPKIIPNDVTVEGTVPSNLHTAITQTKAKQSPGQKSYD